jgi:CBS domain containing-hemolysin-like protein
MIHSAPVPRWPVAQSATASDFGALDWLAVVAAFGLLMFAVIVVAAEEAFNRSSKARANSLRDDEPRRAPRLERLLERPDDQVRNPLRLLVVMAQLTQSALVAILAYRFLEQPAVSIVIALNLIVVFVLGEAVPRTLAILNTDQVSLALARPIGLLLRVGPIRLMARALVGLTNIIVPGKGLRQGPFALPEELIELANAAMEGEVIEQAERDLIESVIEFGDTVVREVMVPRTDMITVEREVTVEDALEVTSLVGFSRVPVVGDNIDDVVGLVYVKDLIRAELDGKPDQGVGELMRHAHFVPETKKVDELLREMQQAKFHMAIAVDEYGGVAGLVTLEDLIEELVGEIVDEYDVEEALVERQMDGSLRVDARILIDELNDFAGLQLPEGAWDTVGGLVFDEFGRVPTAGEICEVDGYRLKVERTQGRRITRVLVSQIPVTVPEVDDNE